MILSLGVKRVAVGVVLELIQNFGRAKWLFDLRK